MSLNKCTHLLQRTLPHHLHSTTTTTRHITTTTTRHIATTSTLNKSRPPVPTPYTRSRARVLPVVHQIAGPHNSQQFTPYPNLTKEDMEEPPPSVSDRVRKFLQLSRGRFEGTKFIPPEINPIKFKELRRELIIKGHVFPEEPLRDRFLDPMIVVEDWTIKKEERLRKVEENMAKMPEWIAEYKETRRLQQQANKEARQKQKNKEWKQFEEKKNKVLAAGMEEKTRRKKGLSQAIKAKVASM